MKKVLFLVCFGVACLSSTAKRLGVACVFNSETAENDQVKIELKESGGILWGLGVYITNKTDQTIYIDRANCFAIENGNSETWFTNSATTNTTTSSSSNMVTVNAGAIARAAGVGGPLGTALSGITVGRGSESGTGTGTTVYEQRVIAIPPHSTVPTYRFHGLALSFDETIIDAGVKAQPFRPVELGAFKEPDTGKRETFKKNTMRHYEKSNTPLKIQAMIKYSFSETFETTNNFILEDYITDIYIVNKMDISHDFLDGKSLPQRQNHRGKLFYFFESGNKRFSSN